MFAKLIAAILFFMVSWSAHAEECPSRIVYSNGNYLKNGSYFYYPNGSYLKNGSYMYYANGNYAMNGSYLYYPNGSYLKNGSYLYYPNGNYLKNGSYLYYANGNYFKNGSYLYYQNGNYIKNGSYYYYSNGNYAKNGSYVYYPNGNYARNGSQLYRPDGSQSPLDELTLADMDSGAVVKYIVTRSEFDAWIDIGPQTIDGNTVKLGYNSADGSINPVFEVANGEAPTSFVENAGDFDLHIAIPTGYDGEVVKIDYTSGTFNCKVESNGSVPDQFFINSDAADISVTVKPGYSPAAVRAALLEALQSL